MVRENFEDLAKLLALMADKKYIDACGVFTEEGKSYVRRYRDSAYIYFVDERCLDLSDPRPGAILEQLKRLEGNDDSPYFWLCENMRNRRSSTFRWHWLKGMLPRMKEQGLLRWNMLYPKDSKNDRLHDCLFYGRWGGGCQITTGGAFDPSVIVKIFGSGIGIKLPTKDGDPDDDSNWRVFRRKNDHEWTMEDRSEKRDITDGEMAETVKRAADYFGVSVASDAALVTAAQLLDDEMDML